MQVVKMFIFFSWKEKEREGDKTWRDKNPVKLALTNNNQGQTWSVIRIDGLQRNSRETRNLQRG